MRRLPLPSRALECGGILWHFRAPGLLETREIMALVPALLGAGEADIAALDRVMIGGSALIGLLWADDSALGALDAVRPPRPYTLDGLTAYGARVRDELDAAGLSLSLLTDLLTQLIQSLTGSDIASAAGKVADFTAPQQESPPSSRPTAG